MAMLEYSFGGVRYAIDGATLAACEGTACGNSFVVGQKIDTNGYFLGFDSLKCCLLRDKSAATGSTLTWNVDHWDVV